MEYARIVVKSNYEKRGDIVLRSYIRALRKIKASLLLNGDDAVIYGKIEEDGKFHEFFTDEIINYDYYEFVSEEELYGLNFVPMSQMYEIKKVIENIIFGIDHEFSYEISSIEDLAKDRAVEFAAYNDLLSGINPYPRLTSNDDPNIYNLYNNFLAKVEAVKKMRELDRAEDFDEYDLNNYENTSKVYVRK